LTQPRKEISTRNISCVCRSGRNLPTCILDGHLHRVTYYQKLYWYNWFSWWWARGCSKHVEDWNKHIRKKKCASSWSFTRIIPRCTVNRTYERS
jgi:hypothetical protein